MTYDDFVAIALELPGTTEGVDKNGSSVTRDCRSMFWLKKWELLCVKVDWNNHDRLLDEHPEVIYKTPHFESYPAVHAHLEKLDDILARELINICWEDAPAKVKFRKRSHP